MFLFISKKKTLLNPHNSFIDLYTELNYNYSGYDEQNSINRCTHIFQFDVLSTHILVVHILIKIIMLMFINKRAPEI